MPLYFAYGSNMLVERITAPTRVPGAVAMGAAGLEGYQLSFGKLSIRTSGHRTGKCDIVEQSGGAVYGVLYEVPEHTTALNCVSSAGTRTAVAPP